MLLARSRGKEKEGRAVLDAAASVEGQLAVRDAEDRVASAQILDEEFLRREHPQGGHKRLARLLQID